MKMKTTIEDSYERLIALLDQYGVQYRLIDYAQEGRTELVSAMRGNTLSQAAKSLVQMVKKCQITRPLRR
jgi:Ala-tRNA(Pro) deacylase